MTLGERHASTHKASQTKNYNLKKVVVFLVILIFGKKTDEQKI